MDKGIEALIADMKSAAKESKELSSIARYKKGADAKDKFTVMATEENALALIAALEQAHQENKEQLARIEELESQRQLAFMACNRWRDKCADAGKRIAELEAAPNGMMQLSNELAELDAVLNWILMLPVPTAKATHFAKRLAVAMEAIRDAGGTAEGGE